jgi:hypothetical protein
LKIKLKKKRIFAILLTIAVLVALSVFVATTSGALATEAEGTWRSLKRRQLYMMSRMLCLTS